MSQYSPATGIPFPQTSGESSPLLEPVRGSRPNVQVQLQLQQQQQHPRQAAATQSKRNLLHHSDSSLGFTLPSAAAAATSSSPSSSSSTTGSLRAMATSFSSNQGESLPSIRNLLHSINHEGEHATVILS